MILLDTSGLLAVVNDQDPRHVDATHAFERERPPYVLSSFVLAEIDYLVEQQAGTSAELRLLRDVAAGAYALAEFSREEVGAAADIVEQFSDLRIGLADASIVVLAGKLRCNRVLTLDERHFRALRTPGGEPFTILPADAVA